MLSYLLNFPILSLHPVLFRCLVSIIRLTLTCKKGADMADANSRTVATTYQPGIWVNSGQTGFTSFGFLVVRPLLLSFRFFYFFPISLSKCSYYFFGRIWTATRLEYCVLGCLVLVLGNQCLVKWEIAIADTTIGYLKPDLCCDLWCSRSFTFLNFTLVTLNHMLITSTILYNWNEPKLSSIDIFWKKVAYLIWIWQYMV